MQNFSRMGSPIKDVRKNTVKIDPLVRFYPHWAIPPPLRGTSANVTKYAVNSDSWTSSN